MVSKNARTARNPKTGEAVDVPAKVVPKFRPSAGLKDAFADMTLADEDDDTIEEAETVEAAE